MPWVRIDDHFDEHPKMAKVGPLGWGVWLAGLAYCNRNLTDGFIPWSVARHLTGFDVVEEDGKVWALSRSSGMVGEDIDADWVIQLLLDAGLWELVENGRGRVDGFRVHDYRDYQPGRDDVQQERERNAERQRRFRERNAITNGSSHEDVTALVTDVSRDDNAGPVPNPVPVPEELPESAHALSSSAIAADAAPRPEETPAGARESDPGFREVSNALARRIRQNNPKARSPSPRQLARWDNTVRLMVERDGRPLSDIRAVLEWSQDDEFWRTNILSMDALRQHYDQLWVKMRAPSRASANGQRPDAWWEQRDDPAWRAAHPYTAAVMDASPGRAPPETPDPDTPMNRSAAERSHASPEERAP